MFVHNGHRRPISNEQSTTLLAGVATETTA
jgi:hypothetical protein